MEGLNFRQLHEFNVALIGKQVWRMLTEPDSLKSRVFKSKYFMNKSFFEVHSSSNDSFVWRGFLAAREVVIKVLVWWVGDGRTINIWNDP